MFYVSAKGFTGFMSSLVFRDEVGMETPDLEAPRKGRCATSGPGREVQVAAGHHLPQGRTPHTQDPSPAVGVSGTRLVWAGATQLHQLGGGNNVKVNNNFALTVEPATMIFRDGSARSPFPDTRSTQGRSSSGRREHSPVGRGAGERSSVAA